MLSIVVACLALVVASIDCQTVNIISRTTWGARPAKSTTKFSAVPKYVFIHHGASTTPTTQSACTSTWRSYQNYHMDDLGWSDIGYNFGICNDGTVFEGRGWNNVGAHAANWNSNSIGICFMGTFSTSAPSTAAQKVAQDLISYGVSLGKISSSYTLGGHRNVGSTECPGNSLYNIIKGWKNFGW